MQLGYTHATLRRMLNFTYHWNEWPADGEASSRAPALAPDQHDDDHGSPADKWATGHAPPGRSRRDGGVPVPQVDACVGLDQSPQTRFS